MVINSKTLFEQSFMDNFNDLELLLFDDSNLVWLHWLDRMWVNLLIGWELIFLFVCVILVVFVIMKFRNVLVIYVGKVVNTVVRGKEQGGWCSKEVRGGYGVGLWKAIRRERDVVSSRLFFCGGEWTKGELLERWMVWGFTSMCLFSHFICFSCLYLFH